MSTVTVTFPQAVEAVKASLDIVTVVSASVTLRKAGRNYTGLCPFHKERTPSFSVSREKSLFKCFGCGEGGDAITFLMKTQNRAFADVIREEADRIGLIIADTPQSPQKKGEQDRLVALMQTAAQWFGTQLTPSVTGYLANRQYDSAAIQQFGLGYAPDSWDSLRKHLGQQFADVTDLQLSEAGLCIMREDRPGSYDRFRHRLMIPIHNDQGTVVGFGGRSLDANTMPKYMNSPETPVYTKSRILYGLHWAKPSIKAKRRAIVMEGYFDVMRAHLAGFTEAVATCGTALTREHVTLLLRCGVDTLYLAFDSDTAGQRAISTGLDVLDGLTNATELKIRVLQLPNGKDPDEFLAVSPPDAFEQVIVQAMTHWQFRCETALSGLDLNTTDGKSKAAVQVADVLKGLKDPIYRRDYASIYAPKLGISPEELLAYSMPVYQHKQSDKRNTFHNKKLVNINTLELKKTPFLMPKHCRAERAFFYQLFKSEDNFNQLYPYLAQIHWVSTEAEAMKDVLTFFAKQPTLADAMREVQVEARQNDTLRNFWVDVQLIETMALGLPSFDNPETFLNAIITTINEAHVHLKKIEKARHGMYDNRPLETRESLLNPYTETNAFITPPNPVQTNHGYTHTIDAQYDFVEALQHKLNMSKPALPAENPKDSNS